VKEYSCMKSYDIFLHFLIEIGKIPNYVRGSFLRTGPAKFDLGETCTLNHWLDGYAMLSKFSIEGDIVTFEKKYLQSDAFTRAKKANKPLITEFGTSKQTDPNKSLFGRLVSAIMPIELSDNDQAALFQIGQDVFATSETCYFRKIDPSNLSTGEKIDTNKCFGTNIACAHPLVDASGAMYNIGSTVITGTKYNIFRVPPPSPNTSSKDLMKKSQIICSIPSSWTGKPFCAISSVFHNEYTKTFLSLTQKLPFVSLQVSCLTITALL
jgi:carotenoid cleavage dioxygenase-like enzyme